MHEFSFTDEYPYVRISLILGVEEHQVSGAQLRGLYCFADATELVAGARQCDS
jgi:hypothetical protein